MRGDSGVDHRFVIPKDICYVVDMNTEVSQGCAEVDDFAAKITRMIHIKGPTNPSDVVSKHWDWPSVKGCLKPLLFVYGEEANVPPITAIKAFAKAFGEALQSLAQAVSKSLGCT